MCGRACSVSQLHVRCQKQKNTSKNHRRNALAPTKAVSNRLSHAKHTTTAPAPPPGPAAPRPAAPARGWCSESTRGPGCPRWRQPRGSRRRQRRAAGASSPRQTPATKRCRYSFFICCYDCCTRDSTCLSAADAAGSRPRHQQGSGRDVGCTGGI